MLSKVVSAGILLALGAQHAAAAEIANIQGREFSGQVAETEMGVVTLFNLRLRFDKQVGDQVDGSGSTDAGETFTFTGQVQGSIVVMGTFTDQIDNGTFTAQINGSTLALQYDELGMAYSGIGTLTENAITSASDPTAVVSRDSQRIGTQLNIGAVHTHVDLSLNGANTGAASVSNGFLLQYGQAGSSIDSQGAGDSFDLPFGVWGAYQHSDTEDSFAATAFKSNRDGVLVGVDVSPWDNFLAGVALGFASVDVDTAFNSGNQDVRELSIIPYLGARLSEQLGTDMDVSFDLSIGYTDISIDQFRLSGPTRVTSNVDATRRFIAGNVNVGQTVGAFYVGATAGILVARDSYDSFLESDGTIVGQREFELGQFRVGGDVSYLHETSYGLWEPYVRVTYQNDYEAETLSVAGAVQPSNDTDDFLIGLGLRFYNQDNITASFDYGKVVGRKDFDDDSFSLMIRADF